VDLGLSNRRALVTGGSKGIGFAIADQLAAAGCDVAVCARGQAGLAEASDRLRARGQRVVALTCDVTDPHNVERTLAAVREDFGGVDILVNNAGGDVEASGLLEDVGSEVWDRVLQANALSTLRFTLSVLGGMKERGWGRVVTITSTLGRQGGGTPWYNMAKTAQTALMKNLARRKDLARAGITFNCVAPGPIDTPDSIWGRRGRDDPEGMRRLADERFPMGRLGTPAEVAHAVVFLCAAQATYVNGCTLTVDGCDSAVY